MHKQQLPIRTPCGEDWDSMSGDARARHCQACERQVFNLSAMTRREAEAAVAGWKARPGTRVCVRYAAGEDGEVMFRREPLLPAALLVRARQVALASGLVAAALPGCTPAGPVSGAVAARAASGEAAEALGQAGHCTVSLEPVIPAELRLHASGCQPPAPTPAAPVQEPAPAPVQGPAWHPTEVIISIPPVAKRGKKAHQKPPRPRPPQFLMGDVALE